MKPVAIIVAIVAAIGAFLFFGPSFSSAAAPDFTLTTRAGGQGRAVSLSQLRGQVVVLDFWASWCPPCRAAIPVLERIHRDYGDRGVVVIGINVNDNVDPHEFMDSVGATYTVLVDSGQTARSYKVKGIPTLVVIDKEGQIRFRKSGFGGRTDAQMRAAIDASLAG